MNRKKIALCFSSFIAQFSICMVNFAMIYYMKLYYDLTSSQIGIASSLYTVTYFISCLAFSSLFGKLSRALKSFIAFFGMALSIMMILIIDSVSVMYLMLGLYGIAMSFLWPNMEDWITEGTEGRELAKASSAFNFSWSFGAGLSTMVGGFLVELSISLPIKLASLFFIIILFFLLTLRKKEEKMDVKKGKDEIVKEDHSTVLRYFSWCGNLLNYTCYSLIINIFPLYALEKLGYSEALSGTLLLFRGLSTCFAFTLFSRLKFWQFNKSVVLFSQALLSLMFIIFSVLKNIISYAVFFALFGVIFALLYQMSIFHGASGAVNREKRMIIHEVVINIGMVLGSTVGGIIYEYFSFNAILYILSALAFAFFLLESLISLKAFKRV